MKVKYPRTPHLPWSPGATSDDTWIDPTCFLSKQVVITEKMDGENTTLYRDGLHARSLDSRHHPSRSWVKDFHSSIKHNIPENFRICGENLYAVHSIEYKDLDSYFLVFSIWEGDTCLSWADTIEYCSMLGLDLVPTIATEIYDQKSLIYGLSTTIQFQGKEGYVVRLADSFKFEDFNKSVAKWVRPNHVQTDKHWINRELRVNQLTKRVASTCNQYWR